MEKKEFYYIQTVADECRIDFFINKEYILYISNYHTKGMVLCCGSNENWIEIIKDRGYWDYFYRKMFPNVYQYGIPGCEHTRACIQQFIDAVKKIEN